MTRQVSPDAPDMRWRRARRWTLALVLAVQAGAVVVLVGVLVPNLGPQPASQLGVAALLLAAAAAHIELLHVVARRRALSTGSSLHTDFTSVWTFALALLLPLPLGAITAAAAGLYAPLRVGSGNNDRYYKALFSGSTTFYSAMAAQAVLWLFGGPALLTGSDPLQIVGLLVPLLTYALTTSVLRAVVVALARGTRMRLCPSKPGVVKIEIVSLALGALIAMMIANNLLWALLFLAPALWLLHRSVEAAELDNRADDEPDTGLVHPAAWHRAARRRLRRPQNATAILLARIDHLPEISDLHGPRATAQVLAAVRSELRACVRAHDIIGHFGPAEVAVLLPAAEAVLQRINHEVGERLQNLHVQVDGASGVGPAASGATGTATAVVSVRVSVASVQTPQDGLTLDELLETANAALRRAGAPAHGLAAYRLARHRGPSAL